MFQISQTHLNYFGKKFFTFFSLKWCRISSGLPSEFRFLYCSLNGEFQVTDASFELTVTDATKLVAWKLSVNCDKLLILLIKFMARLPDPLSIRCKPFSPSHYLQILLLSLISSAMEFSDCLSFPLWETLHHHRVYW